MDKHVAFRKWMRVFAVRMRIGLLLLLVLSAIYADLTKSWGAFLGILPFTLFLIPGFIEWPFEVRWPQHPAFRMLLLMLPVATPAVFIGSYSRFGLLGAFIYTAVFLSCELLALVLVAVWMKRAGLKL